MSSITAQLIDFHKKETWHKDALSDSELEHYFDVLLKKERILMVMDKELVLGYVESWRINFEQLGRILCGERFCAESEDVQTGAIAYVANTHVLPQYRNFGVVSSLKNQFIKQNFTCKYFVGEARRKKHQPFKCFNRSEIIEKYLKEGVQSGLD
jgi:ribosomal protein S18 acetylase RimI-like enzyme